MSIYLRDTTLGLKECGRAGAVIALLALALGLRPAASGAAVLEGAAWPRTMSGGIANTISTATAQSKTFIAAADASVSSAQPRVNFGRSSLLTLEGSPLGKTYLRFRLHGLAGNVVQARLRLFVADGSGKFLVHGVRSGIWSEGAITHANAPGLTAVIGYPAAAKRGWTEFDLTGLVRGNGTLMFALTRFSPQKLSFASRELPARAPRLVVETERRIAPVIVAAGDIGCSRSDPSFLGGNGTARHCRMKATSDVALNLRPDSVLGLGDTLNSPGIFEEFMGSFHPTWGRLKSRLRPVPGNWEYEDPGASGYFRYFGSAAGDPGLGYYSFDLGAWRLIALNSNCAQAGGCRQGSPQEQWLKAELARSRNRCTLAYIHHAGAGAGGGYGKVDAIWRALAEGGAELLLSGHRHVYERFAELDANGDPAPGSGVRQFIAGTGGHSHGNLLPPRTSSEVQNAETFGVLRLALRSGSYEWRFVPVAGGSFTDRGSARCH